MRLTVFKMKISPLSNFFCLFVFNFSIKARRICESSYKTICNSIENVQFLHDNKFIVQFRLGYGGIGSCSCVFVSISCIYESFILFVHGDVVQNLLAFFCWIFLSFLYFWKLFSCKRLVVRKRTLLSTIIDYRN